MFVRALSTEGKISPFRGNFSPWKRMDPPRKSGASITALFVAAQVREFASVFGPSRALDQGGPQGPIFRLEGPRMAKKKLKKGKKIQGTKTLGGWRMNLT